MSETKNKTIRVSLDAGYNGVKVVVEDGSSFWCPSNVLSERFSGSNGLPTRITGEAGEDDILMFESDENGNVEQFAIGHMSQVLKRSLSVTQNEEYDDLGKLEIGRFYSPDFRRLCLTAIYCAVRKAGEENGVSYFGDNFDTLIDLCVSVPAMFYDALDKNNKFKSQFLGRNGFSVSIAGSEPKATEFIISKLSVANQVLACIHGYADDDEGYFDKLDLDTDFPLLCLDMGYGTTGIAVIQEEAYCDVTKIESNTQYTMRQVNKDTAKEITQKTRKECTHHRIEDAISSGSAAAIEFPYMNGTVKETLNIREYQARHIENTVNELFDYISGKYDLTELRTVLICGGSGACFYEALCKRFVEAKLLSAEHVILAKGEYKGKVYDPLYTVALGYIKQSAGDDE